MSEADEQDAIAADDSQIAQLMRLSGRRPRPTDAQRARARAAAHAEWTLVARSRRWHLWRLAMGSAVAVGLLTFVVASWLSRSTPSSLPSEVASVRAMAGTLRVRSQATDRVLRDAGGHLAAGDRVETQKDSRAALVFADSLEVRLDHDTAVTLDTGRLTLLRGTAYVDVGPAARHVGFVVETPLGTVRHVGTQFEVRWLSDDALRIRVREGTVAVEHHTTALTARAGEALRLSARAPVQREMISTVGADWEWTHALAKPFRLEGATLETFLDWAGREQGWQWQFDSVAMQRRFERTPLHGTIEGLTPEEAVAAVLPTCGLTGRLEGHRLIISPRSRR